MSERALQLARWIEWSDRETAHFRKHGESYDPANPVPEFTEPEPPRPDGYSDDDLVRSTLARAVIEQADEIERLKCERDEALAGEERMRIVRSAVDEHQVQVTKAHIYDLKSALREALDADADDCRSLGDARRAELRRLVG